MLLQALRLRDPATAEHCRRVRAVALRLASEISLSAEEKKLLPYAALLHDLGKLAAAETCPKKGGNPSLEALQNQATQSLTIVQQCSALEPLLPILSHCNERWDGRGFPLGLQGEAIPKLARLVAVADFIDSRCRTDPQLRALATEAGHSFDPSMVAPALRIANDLLALDPV